MGRQFVGILEFIPKVPDCILEVLASSLCLHQTAGETVIKNDKGPREALRVSVRAVANGFA